SNDQWKFTPTGNGYYRVVNKKSGLVLNVNGASTTAGALIVQSTYTSDSTYSDEWLIQPAGDGLYNFVNRRSGLYLDIPGGSTTPGTQLDQQVANGGANQKFNINGAAILPFSLTANPSSQTVNVGSGTTFTINMTTNPGFSGSVTFSLSGLPANTTGSFNPTSLNSAGSTVLRSE